MCYSAQVVADFKRLSRQYRSAIDYEAFVALYAFHPQGARPKTPRALDRTFALDDAAQAQAVADAIGQWDMLEKNQLEELVFTQRQRLVGAERTLRTKTTKKAQNDLRVATNKIDRALVKLRALQNGKLTPGDSRIFPGVYAPVIVQSGTDRLIRPMRYQCRLQGVPADFDRKYPGTYNARRNSLEGFWAKSFGRKHAVIVVQKFYEHVVRYTRTEGAQDAQAENVILEFAPEPYQEMIVACLWSEWHGPGGRLLSFAAITDEPPPEVAAAGHDRCIIPIKPENVHAWLNPDPRDLHACYQILDDRPPLYFEHRLAA